MDRLFTPAGQRPVMADHRSTPDEGDDGAEAEESAGTEDEAEAGDDTGDPMVHEGGTDEAALETVGDEPADEDLSTEELRERVEAEYDFDEFGPADMERMSVEEWEAAFDPGTWITGERLLDRLEADLKQRVLDRDVFARVERLADPDRLVAYSDEGYAVVYPDGSIEGRGTVLRDVKPSVALASMEDYDVPDLPDEELLPEPMDVPTGSGEFGNLMLQVVAGAQLLAGLGVLASPLLVDYSWQGFVVVLFVGIGFLFIGLLLFFTVANARLSDRFRAEEYRNRLRAVGVESGERPEFLPDHARETPALDRDDRDGDREDDGTAPENDGVNRETPGGDDTRPEGG
jgi:hypothetical protein